jgi:hypothetical protein
MFFRSSSACVLLCRHGTACEGRRHYGIEKNTKETYYLPKYLYENEVRLLHALSLY